VIVHHNRGSAFIGHEWAQHLVQCSGARLSFAPDGPRENPEMQLFFGRFKIENLSLFLSARMIEKLSDVVRRRICYYNWKRRHSSLGNQAPMRYAKNLERS